MGMKINTELPLPAYLKAKVSAAGRTGETESRKR